MEPISVVIPLGPDVAYKEYLEDCIDSVLTQTYLPDEIIFIDDGMHISIPDLYCLFRECGYGSDYYNQGHYNEVLWKGRDGEVTDRVPDNLGEVYCATFGGCVGDTGKIKGDNRIKIKYHRTWWNVGVADAFNFGIALSRNNLVFTIGSDDKMLPTCLEKCAEAYDKHQKEGWYYVKYQLESGDILQIQNNTAMVTKKLWQETGGFPPSAGVGACDALLLSIMMKHMPDRIIPVESDEPLCWLREGDHQDTRKNGWLFGDEIVSIRNKETLRWKAKN